MTKNLRDLIARGETYEVEFKSNLNDDAIVETAVCLTNGGGGWLLIGVGDDGNIIGVPLRHDYSTQGHRIVAMIANKTLPPLTVEVEVEQLDDKTVVAVRVPRSRTVVATTSGRYLRRATEVHGKPECRPMHPYEVQGRISMPGGLDLSTLPLNRLNIEDLDSSELDRFRCLAR